MFPSGSDAPDDETLAAACESLASLAPLTAVDGPWRSGAFSLLARSGMLAGFIPTADGGTGAGEPAIVTALVAIAERCLTTALSLTQWASAVRVIAGGPPAVRATALPLLARGAAFTTVGISQLTTSRRHLAAPALAATAHDGGWRLDGLCPWVTGADSCDTIVTGATTADGSQMFFVVRTDSPGIMIEPPLEMLALSGSRTSVVRFAGVRPEHAIPPPAGGTRTGGLATTALAVGSARAAAAVLHREAALRPALAPIAAGFSAETDAIASRLIAAARDGIDAADRDALRVEANGLVVRAAQGALTASKGAGFVTGHPAERLVRESHFFLVWSCPQAVTDAVLCELAGVE